MAIMKLTAFNAGLKGKVAGTIFQSNPAGQVVKKDNGLIDAIASGAKLTKADAGRVMNPQRNTTIISTNWKDMSSVERGSWISGAASFPFKNKWGDTYTASGFQVYMSLNIALLNAGGALLNVCPVPGIILPGDPFTVTYNNSAFTLELDLPAISVGYWMKLYATRSIGVGIMPKQSMYKCIKVFDNTLTPPENITSDYTDQFGYIVPNGRIWFQLIACNKLTGQQGLPYIFDVLTS